MGSWFSRSGGVVRHATTICNRGKGASWQYHRNAAFRRQILGILSVLPRKHGVPSRVSSFRGGTAKMRPLREVHLQDVGAFNAATPDRGCVEDQPQRPGRDEELYLRVMW